MSLLELENPSLSVLPLSQETYHFPVSLLDHLLKRIILKKKFSTLKKKDIIWFLMEKAEAITCSVIECLTGTTKTKEKYF